MTTTATAKKPITRRTADERIAEHEAEIERIRQREAAKELRGSEEIKKAVAAARQVAAAAKLAEASGDTDLAQAAEAAREALSRALEAKGLPPVQAPQKRKRKAKKA